MNTRHYGKTALTVLFLLLCTGLAFSQTLTSVTVSPSTTNTAGKYTITGTLLNNAAADIDANLDSIIIVFNDSTTVPETIDPTKVTVNNTASNAVDVSGTEHRRVAILSPVNIKKNGGTPGQFTIVFSSSVPITNPVYPATYRVSFFTSKTRTPVIHSPLYTITSSSSNILSLGVTPNPSVETLPASYTVSFNTGSGGALTASSTITLAFPLATTIPDGALAGVTVNGTPASATALSDTVIIYCPVGVAAGNSVTIQFGIGSGIINPTFGTYTLWARTSSETAWVPSAEYYITTSTQMSITAVTVTPSTVNATAGYSLEFYTSSTGAMTAYNDSIIFVFSQNTYIPDEITASLITITSGGYSDAAGAVIIRNKNKADEDTLILVVPINISNSSSVGITISSGAGILNPSVLGNYYVSLKTTKDTTPVNSSAYAITNSTTKVSSAFVTPTRTAINVRSPYQFEFNLGAQGRLKPDASTISIDFDDRYLLDTIRSNYDSTYISVGGGSYVWVDTGNINATNTTKTLRLTVPASVYTNNGDKIVLILKRKIGSQPILNPGIAGSYVVDIFTSVESTPVTSQSYYIGGTAITLNSISLSSYGVNQTVRDSFSISGAQMLKSPDNDWISFVFPDSTLLTPSRITPTNTKINGANTKSVQVALATRTVTLYANANVTPTSVVFVDSGGIRNPPVPSSTYYKTTVRTSLDLQPVISSPYAITGNNTSVTAVTATANPSVINAYSSVYTFNMRTTTVGRLVGGTPAGSSYIDITFGYRTRIPSFITPSSVKISGQACETVSVLASGDSGKVRVYLPNGLVIGNSTTFAVVFDSSARLDNRNPEGTSTVSVKTSSDTLSVSANYTLTLTQALSITSVTPTPSTVNAKAGYSVKFTTGSSGALVQGDTIYILFPSNTYVPPTLSKTDITVNGLNPLFNPVVVGDSLKLTVPQAGGIGNLTSVTVLINSTGGLLNPTLVASNYTIKLRTKSEPVLVTSPTYSISVASSTVTQAVVTVLDPRTNVTSPYIFEFNVGEFGRLIPGSSTITINLPHSDYLGRISLIKSNYDSTYITVNGTTTVKVDTTNFSLASRIITITVPSSLIILNNAQLKIDIRNKGAINPITNPVNQQSYIANIKTSVENSYVASYPYSITNTPAVSDIRVMVNPDTVNAPSNDTIRFTLHTTGSNLVANNSTITITFPNNTYIPPVIPVSSVQIATQVNNNFANAYAVSTNPSQRTITITTPSNANNGDSVRVAILSSANLQNPSIYGNYTLLIKTNKQPANGTSEPYTLVPTTTTISFDSLTIIPNYPGSTGLYKWYVKTGTRGRLLSGSSTITMIFPYDAVFTQGVPATSKVTINSVNPSSLSLIEGSGTNPDTLIATVPNSVTIGNLASVTVIIDSSAGIQNVSSTAFKSYKIYTSVEPYADSIDVSLPVVLAYFRTVQNDESVTLNWRTESEVDNAYWLVQKSEADDPDTELSSLKYSTVSTLKGQGTTTSATDYVWTDSDILPDRTYVYRIVDIAYDGTMTYHEPQKVTIAGPKKFTLYQNYPNPFNPATSVKYQIPYESKVTLTIYNALGQKVTELVDRNQTQGFYTVRWNGRNDRQSAVASGLYICRIKAKPLNGKKTWTASKRCSF